MTAAGKFSQMDVKRLIKGTIAAGESVREVGLDDNGLPVVRVGEPDKTEVASDEWDKTREETSIA